MKIIRIETLIERIKKRINKYKIFINTLIINYAQS